MDGASKFVKGGCGIAGLFIHVDKYRGRACLLGMIHMI